MTKQNQCIIRTISIFLLCILAQSFFVHDVSASEVTQTPIEKKVALTFDDGPYGEPTRQILAILKQEQVHATFFVMGENVEKYPDIAKAIVDDGNVIANHSYDHPKNMTSEPTKKFDSELILTENAIFTATNKLPDLFRAPYGRTSAPLLKKLHDEKYSLVRWTLDTLDWNFPKSPSDAIVKRVLTKVHPNDIILMHDGRDTKIGYPRDNIVDALPKVIEGLKKAGYTLVTVDQIVGKSAYFDSKETQQ
ncbi:MAG: polysaccharide deacetylase family protein [bacterium]